jgi:hypothetical protein
LLRKCWLRKRCAEEVLLLKSCCRHRRDAVVAEETLLSLRNIGADEVLAAAEATLDGTAAEETLPLRNAAAEEMLASPSRL